MKGLGDRKHCKLIDQLLCDKRYTAVALSYRKIRGMIGSVRSRYETISGTSNISFAFHFDTCLSSLMIRNLLSYATTVNFE